MTDQDQGQEKSQEDLERQERLARRWHATDTWRMSQDDFRRFARTGEFAPSENSPEQGG